VIALSRTEEISIHAPREGSDLESGCAAMKEWLFQSTLPVRGATHRGQTISYTLRFQSTLPVRGATNQLAKAILAEEFQSTLPVRGATRITPSTNAE